MDVLKFQDPVFGPFSLRSYCKGVIDSAPFQRLRNLYQLGVTRFVFAGATHSRFEHSLGCAHKAYKVAAHTFKTQGGLRAGDAWGYGVDMEEDDVRIVTLAGLCHDLGHGPLSHPFDKLMQRLGVKDWRHEEMSGRLVQYMVDECGLELQREDDVRRITELIEGEPRGAHPPAPMAEGQPGRAGRRFLFDIVANKRNGVDVDKMDYLKRDAQACGVAHGCNVERLLQKYSTKVLEDELCYDYSEYLTVLKLFRTREDLYREVYTLHTCKAIELMAVDALAAAEPLLGIAERVREPQTFISLDDTILTKLQHYRTDHRGKLDDAQDKALRAAEAILHRLEGRQLYRFGNQFTVPPEFLVDSRWDSMKKRFTAEEVASHGGSGSGDIPGGLTAADVIVDENKIDHTKGDKNPAELVGFFNHPTPNVLGRIDRNQIVGIMPQIFQERVLRVFTPHQDERYVRAIERALEAWCRHHFGGDRRMATPVRPPRQQGGAGGANGAALPPMLPREAVTNAMLDSLRQPSDGGAGSGSGSGPALEATPTRRPRLAGPGEGLEDPGPGDRSKRPRPGA
ncbi:hypothetical protein HYH03_013492 [Edaphochlamys debaryana]|uniref:HD/PDEase domain-containing protein n=1 Tax=Edaphochlamys debaryana TaxID=47281 RepID=A0A835XQW5_9CHLO|nr:hypothetical protein HYH03_013492 [Edaphochlamys debaryana]|eukprot:KAG2487912.1 hypothetical protein HYH03_013492 [Edaphochlamys debaryana]